MQGVDWNAMRARYQPLVDRVSDREELVGLRGLIMRTPGQRQQNFALESMINEAAAKAKAATRRTQTRRARKAS